MELCVLPLLLVCVGGRSPSRTVSGATAAAAVQRGSWCVESLFNSSWQQQLYSFIYVCRTRTIILLKNYCYFDGVTEDTYICQYCSSHSPSSAGIMESTVSTLGIEPGLHLSPQRCYKYF